jgi:hypothetical protein
LASVENDRGPTAPVRPVCAPTVCGTARGRVSVAISCEPVT